MQPQISTLFKKFRVIDDSDFGRLIRLPVLHLIDVDDESTNWEERNRLSLLLSQLAETVGQGDKDLVYFDEDIYDARNFSFISYKPPSFFRDVFPKVHLLFVTEFPDTYSIQVCCGDDVKNEGQMIFNKEECYITKTMERVLHQHGLID